MVQTVAPVPFLVFELMTVSSLASLHGDGGK